MINISSRFHSGNIEVVDASDPENVRLNIVPDAGGDHYQWFHFRVTGAQGQMLKMSLLNAEGASYTDGWEGYRCCASYDGENWFRVDTKYEDEVLSIQHKPACDSVFFAYFAPYSEQRHFEFLGRSQRVPGVQLEVIGQSLQGRDIDLLSVGRGEIPCWIIARQHPGESMAEWLVEGLVERLLDPSDATARGLLDKAKFYIVPNMNPDGSALGHLRNNAAGANLNREWESPTKERSPEVLCVRNRMDEVGLRFCLDVHGDEGLPYNFIAGADGVEGLSEKIVNARHQYEGRLVELNADFQTKYGYPKAEPGRANMTMATTQLSKRFDALALTLEQPFKDNKNAPMPHEGWSPRRCKALGRTQLDALAFVLTDLV